MFVVYFLCCGEVGSSVSVNLDLSHLISRWLNPSILRQGSQLCSALLMNLPALTVWIFISIHAYFLTVFSLVFGYSSKYSSQALSRGSTTMKPVCFNWGGGSTTSIAWQTWPYWWLVRVILFTVSFLTFQSMATSKVLEASLSPVFFLFFLFCLSFKLIGLCWL